MSGSAPATQKCPLPITVKSFAATPTGVAMIAAAASEISAYDKILTTLGEGIGANASKLQIHPVLPAADAFAVHGLTAQESHQNGLTGDWADSIEGGISVFGRKRSVGRHA